MGRQWHFLAAHNRPPSASSLTVSGSNVPSRSIIRENRAPNGKKTAKGVRREGIQDLSRLIKTFLRLTLKHDPTPRSAATGLAHGATCGRPDACLSVAATRDNWARMAGTTGQFKTIQGGKVR